MHRTVSSTIAILLLALSASGLRAQSTDLAHHDFFYAGESKDRHASIVRGGKVVWTWDEPDGRGEISDATLLSNGNVLIAHQFAVELIAPDKTVLWRYDVPAGHEVHTAQPIGFDRVLYIQNGDPALVRVVNIQSNAVEREFQLPTRNPASTHGQFRHARLTAAGTLLVAHMDLGKVVEYDAHGNALWSSPAEGVWGVAPLANGNILITGRSGVREITHRGDTVWMWTPQDTPAYNVTSLQQAWRLPNGNTVINNWVNQWNAPTATGAVQAIEVTPNKKVVWVLNAWTPPVDLGPATTIQFLDPGLPRHPEDVHFGDIR
jgi:hypothetical protein